LDTDFSNKDNRYSRQVLFSPISSKGQELLLNSSAVIAGCGGLGSVLASNLARAGVGRLRLIDKDIPEENNLQRQLLFSEEDVKNRSPKAVAAAKRLKTINSALDIESVYEEIDRSNINELIRGFNIVLDGTDNFPTRYIINKACVEASVPFIYGAVAASYGMVFNAMPGRGICLRCLFKEEPRGDNVLNCNTVGIINTAVNVVASIQSTEALKFLTGNIDDMVCGLINIDVWDLSLDIIDIKKDKDNRCPVCGTR
jgi:molybdopterin/thiamine biosynthesis adenylyltransferase